MKNLGSISSTWLHAAFTCANALVLNFYFICILSFNYFELKVGPTFTLYTKKSSINLLAQKLCIKWWWNWLNDVFHPIQKVKTGKLCRSFEHVVVRCLCKVFLIFANAICQRFWPLMDFAIIFCLDKFSIKAWRLNFLEH